MPHAAAAKVREALAAIEDAAQRSDLEQVLVLVASAVALSENRACRSARFVQHSLHRTRV